MKFKEGFVYHIRNEYFLRVGDEHLMRNKEHGGFRPALLCFQDEVSGLLWFVPLSSRVEKFQDIHDQKVARYGDCLGIEIGAYGGKGSAFLIQNLFPARPEDIHHIHLVAGEAKPVRYSIQKKVRKKVKKVMEITKRGKTVTFTNIKRLEALLLHERELEEVRREKSDREYDKESADEYLPSLEMTLEHALCNRQSQEAKSRKTKHGPPRSM